MSNRLLSILVCFLLLWCLVLSYVLSNVSVGDNDAKEVVEYRINGISSDLTQVVDSVKTGVVSITGAEKALTGFIYRQDSSALYVITSYSPLRNASYLKVVYDGGVSEAAELLAYDVYSDVAVLSVKSVFTVRPLALGDSTGVKEGSFVLTVSNLGGERGINYFLSMVSADEAIYSRTLYRDEQPQTYYASLLSLSDSFSSGSLALNMAGELLGLISDDRYVLPSDELRIVADELIAQGSVNKVFLGLKGLYVSRMANYLKNGLGISIDSFDGYYVESVRNGSLASLSGIEAGDIILSINGVLLNERDDLLEVIYSGEKAFDFVVLRGKSSISLHGELSD